MFKQAAGVLAVLLVVSLLTHIQAQRVPQPNPRLGENPAIVVITEGDSPRAALEAAHKRADEYCQAMGSSWGRLLRQVNRVEEVRTGERVLVRTTFEMTAGITPEALLPKGN